MAGYGRLGLVGTAVDFGWRSVWRRPCLLLRDGGFRPPAEPARRRHSSQRGRERVLSCRARSRRSSWCRVARCVPTCSFCVSLVVLVRHGVFWHSGQWRSGSCAEQARGVVALVEIEAAQVRCSGRPERAAQYVLARDRRRGQGLVWCPRPGTVPALCLADLGARCRVSVPTCSGEGMAESIPASRYCRQTRRRCCGGNAGGESVAAVPRSRRPVT